MSFARSLGRGLGVMRNRALLTLTLGHYTVDMYGGLLPILYPLLRDEFDLNLKTVGTGVAGVHRGISPEPAAVRLDRGQVRDKISSG